MADNQREIERLQRQISNANRELRNIERDYNDRIKQETAKMRREMQNFSANLKQDYIQKLQEMEQSFSNAYLNEMERMRRRYNELTEQVAIYENELNEAMERLEAEQARLIQENKAKNQQYEEAANKAVQKLKQSIQDACQFPVDIFYPHAIQRYIEAGEEAEKLLQNKLYTLAVPKAECATDAVKRLENSTKQKMEELDTLFEIYRMKLETLTKSIFSDGRLNLKDGDEVVLELTEQDIDYWSDRLYSELKELLQEHQANVDGGTGQWIKKCANQALDPAILLDKEIQRLDMIPQKLSICISYATSACDCFNHTSVIEETVETVLREQNYEFTGIAYGPCKCGNDASKGFQEYFHQYLQDEICIKENGKADYREERVLTFEKCHTINEKPDICRLYIIPVRKEKTVSYRIYMQLEAEYFPTMVQESLSNILGRNGVYVETAKSAMNIATDAGRPLTLKETDNFTATVTEADLRQKYSLGK